MCTYFRNPARWFGDQFPGPGAPTGEGGRAAEVHLSVAGGERQIGRVL